jgi:hypothetical protein
MVGDHFTKWMEAYPLANIEAKTIAEKFTYMNLLVDIGFHWKYILIRALNFSLMFLENCVLFLLRIKLEPQHSDLNRMGWLSALTEHLKVC